MWFNGQALDRAQPLHGPALRRLLGLRRDTQHSQLRYVELNDAHGKPFAASGANTNYRCGFTDKDYNFVLVGLQGSSGYWVDKLGPSQAIVDV
jgi:hypothetical protein